ncbi:MAG: family 20 glycosylhydrolase [Opitutae bacterium]|nr:family 20 glycosylhydrolase [Opitutae bacterium]
MPDYGKIRFLPQPRRVTFESTASTLKGVDFCRLEVTRSLLGSVPGPIVLAEVAGLPTLEDYRLQVAPQAVILRAGCERGWFYGLHTLKQLAAQCPGNLPLCRIEDGPDFPNRGFMLDVSRDKVPKLGALLQLIELMAACKYNQLQLYMEHTYAYAGHEIVWRSASPFHSADIRKLDAFCRERFIELVPNQNTFGHMHRWLIHEPYRHMAERPDGGETDLGYRPEPQGLCATDPASIELVDDLLGQLLPQFRSRQVNIGCDETIDLGYGRSKTAVQNLGRGRVYLNYVNQVIELCRNKGYTVQLWGDIILKYPELVEELPDNCIALNWGYEGDHPFQRETELFRRAGIPFYVCPGTSSWNSIVGRTDNMLRNVRNAAEQGRKNNASGFLLTDWGDNGHWQPLSVVIPALLYGAGVSWNGRGNEAEGLARQIDAIDAGSNGWGRLLLDAGNLYALPQYVLHNRSVLFDLLQGGDDAIETMQALTLPGLEKTLRQTRRLLARLGRLSPPGKDSLLRKDEIHWSLSMLELACLRGLQSKRGSELKTWRRSALELKARFVEIWNLRHRPGGLRDSLKRFEPLVEEKFPPCK